MLLEELGHGEMHSVDDFKYIHVYFTSFFFHFDYLNSMNKSVMYRWKTW